MSYDDFNEDSLQDRRFAAPRTFSEAEVRERTNSIDRISRQSEELGEYDKFTPTDTTPLTEAAHLVELAKVIRQCALLSPCICREWLCSQPECGETHCDRNGNCVRHSILALLTHAMLRAEKEGSRENRPVETERNASL